MCLGLYYIMDIFIMVIQMAFYKYASYAPKLSISTSKYMLTSDTFFFSCNEVLGMYLCEESKETGWAQCP